jgi:site-specific DNA-methyltransferase (adenine-specific)
VTWQKKRAYGKSHDYLYCREEILWFSKSQERTEVTFNIPYLDEKRGYAGFSEKYPAKSEFKRVSNVWNDITELFKTEREAQKPLPLLERIINTHSNKNDLVIDFFSGWGTTGVAAIKLGRQFKGCEKDIEDAEKANARCQEVFAKFGIIQK